MNAVGDTFQMPAGQERALGRAIHIEWLSVFFLLSIIVLMYVVMGSSQAMKAMWVEDALSLIPSISFLVGAHFRSKPPDETFPYGYRRMVLVCYLAGAVALLGVGFYILTDSLLKLIRGEHPSIPSLQVFGHYIWMGWIMIAVLIYSVIPPMVLGRMKNPLATELHDKALHVSAKLDKGDWLSGIAGVAGITGIAFGLWWADGVAAAIISLDVLRDGYAGLMNSVSQLMNKRPSKVGSDEKDPVIDRLQQALERLDWVERVRVRLREDGDVFTGEAFLVPRDERDLMARLQEAKDVANAVDWRLHEVQPIPMRSLE